MNCFSICMYLVMVCEILFPKNDRRGKILFRNVNAVSIDSSWKNLTDKADITLPRKFKWADQELKDLIRKGDKVIIKLGYDDTLVEEFSGYVVDIEAGIPVKIYCEDNMYQLKKTPTNKSYANVKLAQLLKDIVPAWVKLDVIDVDLGAFRIEKSTVAKVLEKLKESYGLFSYFRGDTLYCGKVYQDIETVERKYHFQRNIVSHDLKYRTKEDLRIKVTATSYLSTGKKIEVTLGDDDGEERTLSYYGIESQESLKKLAQQDMDKLKIDGYKGNFVTFGFPPVKHGYIANLVDDEYPERTGKNYIDSVKSDFSSSGFRRTIEPGPRAI
jgi:hypothetical protein